MHTLTLTALLLAPLLLAACEKPPEPVADAPAEPAPAAEPTAPAAPAAPVDDSEQAKRQAALDYATMEDKYINDASAQWAESATASTTFGGAQPDDNRLAKNVAGPVDGLTWINNQQDVGFDWLEAAYAKPVNATEVRLVLPGDQGVEAISKVELQDTDGKWNLIWSGLSDVKEDRRGNRTWFVRSFPATAYKVKAVKYTFANNVQHGYKVVDAAQLIGQ